MTSVKLVLKKVSPQQMFMISAILVNGGNYLYNLLLGRILGPGAFADAALLVTLLLVLSFIGMTFQLATTKFAVVYSGDVWIAFKNTMYRYAAFFGITVGVLIILFSSQLQDIFQTRSSLIFVLFGLAVPLYFLMSVNRGRFQGRQEFGKLAATYQTEMWSRLLLTFIALWLLPFESGIVIALGIGLSFCFGLFPSGIKMTNFRSNFHLTSTQLREVWVFIGLAAGYELTQIIINNSDILLVKHYFDNYKAGLYSSLALIGRVVYFVAWMFVMLLMPTVIQKQKDSEPTKPVLLRYVLLIGALSATIVIACSLMPEFIITVMFGESYLPISGLLWKYALATSLFAVSNIFAYYFLSLNQYIPVILSGVLGLSQVFLITFFHSDLAMVVHVQILAMLILLFAQILFFFASNKTSASRRDNDINTKEV